MKKPSQLLYATLLLCLMCFAVQNSRAQTPPAWWLPSTAGDADDITRDGNVGIGTVPSSLLLLPARLDILHDGLPEDGSATTGLRILSGEATEDRGDFVHIAEYNVVPLSGYSMGATYFTVKNTGDVGIGTASPSADLHIKSKAYDTDRSGDIPGTNAITVSDPDNVPIMQLKNLGTGTTHGAFMYLRTLPGDPAFGIIQDDNSTTPFFVAGDGTIGMGLNLETQTPEAQLDLRQINGMSKLARFCTQDEERFVVAATGVTSIKSAADVGVALNLITQATSGWANEIRFTTTSGNRHTIYDDLDHEALVISPGIGSSMTEKILQVKGDLNVDEKVVIGGEAPTTGAFTPFALAVNGTIVSKKVMVETSDWSDKVFDKNYKLTPLTEVENYITANRHLPEIPSESEAIKKGIDVGEMNKLLLQKVEELTLYTISLQKEVDLLKAKK